MANAALAALESALRVKKLDRTLTSALAPLEQAAGDCAATGIEAVAFNGFIVDRPFIVAIRERLSGAVVFAGLIGDPTFEDPGPDGYADRCD